MQGRVDTLDKIALTVIVVSFALLFLAINLWPGVVRVLFGLIVVTLVLLVIKHVWGD